MPNIIADGARGVDGGAGFDFNSPAGNGINGNMANCNWLDDDCAQSGGTGGPGLPGGEGGPGGPAAHGGFIDIEVNSFSALITLSAKGGAGGNGGRGGKGQDGGKGGKGGDGDDCEWGRHGGNGGPGGAGGIGGPGGPGGNGGTIVVRTKNVADGGQPVITPDAGAGGRGGHRRACGSALAWQRSQWPTGHCAVPTDRLRCRAWCSAREGAPGGSALSRLFADFESDVATPPAARCPAACPLLAPRRHQVSAAIARRSRRAPLGGMARFLWVHLTRDHLGRAEAPAEPPGSRARLRRL